MAWREQLNGYVKFLRGTPAAWADITSRNAADADTLYFIAETNATKGRLYLGSKLISDGLVEQITTLNQLQDVLISNNLPTNSILVFNSTTQKWESKSMEYVLSAMVVPMQGATSEADGEGGLVPKPVRGQQNLYLQGNGTWSDPTTSVRADIAFLVDDDTNKTIREIAASVVADIVANAPEDFDTLEEIAEWIANHDDAIDVAQVTSDVAALNNAVFGPNGNDGLVTEVQTIEDILNGTASTDGLITKVTTLEGNYSTLGGRVSVLEGAMSDAEDLLEDLDETLRWKDLVYENE